jgi:hypothetical protein
MEIDVRRIAIEYVRVVESLMDECLSNPLDQWNGQVHAVGKSTNAASAVGVIQRTG